MNFEKENLLQRVLFIWDLTRFKKMYKPGSSMMIVPFHPWLPILLM